MSFIAFKSQLLSKIFVKMFDIFSEYLWCHNDLDKKLKTYTDIYVLIIKFVKCYSSVFGETTLNKDKTLLNNLSDALNRLDNIITDYAYSYFAKKFFLLFQSVEIILHQLSQWFIKLELQKY